MIDKFGIISHNIASLRAEPDSGSEQVSQAIIGDEVGITEESDDYYFVSMDDSYQGWVLKSQIELDISLPHRLTRSIFAPKHRVLGLFVRVYSEPFLLSATVTLLSYWSPFNVLKNLGEFLKIEILGIAGYIHKNDDFIEVDRLPFPFSDISKVALGFVGVPYLWGGTTPFGFDCSGFVQRVYLSVGVRLPRDAYQQFEFELGDKISDAEELECGDLVFFAGSKDPKNRGITHVGMMLDDQRLIHAYGKTGVSLATLLDEEIKKTYQYRGGWRLKLSEKQEFDDADL